MNKLQNIIPKGDVIWDEAEKADRIILEGVEILVSDPPQNDPSFPRSGVIQTREAINPVKTSINARDETNTKKVAAMFLKQDQMPKIHTTQQKDIIAMTEISKQAELIIKNDIKNASKDVIKFSTAAQELRDYVLANEDSDPLLINPASNPFKGPTLAERMSKLCK